MVVTMCGGYCHPCKKKAYDLLADRGVEVSTRHSSFAGYMSSVFRRQGATPCANERAEYEFGHRLLAEVVGIILTAGAPQGADVEEIRGRMRRLGPEERTHRLDVLLEARHQPKQDLASVLANAPGCQHRFAPLTRPKPLCDPATDG